MNEISKNASNKAYCAVSVRLYGVPTPSEGLLHEKSNSATRKNGETFCWEKNPSSLSYESIPPTYAQNLKTNLPRHARLTGSQSILTNANVGRVRGHDIFTFLYNTVRIIDSLRCKPYIVYLFETRLRSILTS